MISKSMWELKKTLTLQGISYSPQKEQLSIFFSEDNPSKPKAEYKHIATTYLHVYNDFQSNTHKAGRKVECVYPSTHKVDAGGPEIQSLFPLHSELEASTR